MSKIFLPFLALLFVLSNQALASGIDDLMSASSIWKMLLSLAFVIALIPLSLMAMKKIQKMQNRFGNTPIQIVNVQALGAKEKLVVIEVEQQKLLLGVTGQSISLIKTLSDKQVDFADYMDSQNSTKGDESKDKSK
ncbi:flagellar protein FliO [Marinomonas sp. MED121]|uniref:flagellar biosynthetic protein FliO n=1 Tax=Marinomonas sp. MED121 TaxID=314277 RepID=UPI00006903EE|nr:flagellar biosynthetic protein FliO [Marinomonas sp. MED121]EAQ66218.1 flagellar protein FliO [Marinomonas sp. MED121]